MLNKIDKFLITFVVISSLFIAIAWNRIENPSILLLNRLIILIAIFAFLKFFANKNFPLIQVLRNAYPLILSGYFYQETVFYNKVFFNNFDGILAKSDLYIFGFQPSIIFSDFISNPLFSELMYFAYFSFYLLIVAVILMLFVKRKDKFSEWAFYLSSSLYIFYLLFIIIPSAGPQFYFNSPDSDLPKAYFFDKIMHLIQEIGEQPTGAFPSSHVGFSVIILYVFYKFQRPFFYLVFPIVFLLILATVYIKAHYVVDVLGGLLIAPLVFLSSKLIYKKIP